ncbi:MAG: hypothetical protein NT091_04215 [Candidatus Falkowbacteria bacterium]|nr:hypothetical protein [Candidatus Taylorbacteria bacterium]MCX6800322.1 hypothetical protein [Candidatus Falkowbacteria bacterium]
MFFNQVESFYTIHVIPAIYFGEINLTLIIGILFCLVVLILFLFKKRIKSFNSVLIILIIIFWSPFFINSFLNDLYDLKDNYAIGNLNIAQKRLIRLCNMGYARGLENGDRWCRLLNYSMLAKDKLPKKSKVYIMAPNDLAVYLDYYVYPDLKIVNLLDKADYILMYQAKNIGFKNKKLSYRDTNIVINGTYRLVDSFGDNNFILMNER